MGYQRKIECQPQVLARLRMIVHYEKITRTVARTCRFYGISRSQFYYWYRRYKADGLQGLMEQKRGPKHHPNRTPPHIEDLVLRLRRERQYGALRLRYVLERYHQVYLSVPTIERIFRTYKVPRLSFKRARPAPKRQRIVREPGRSVQVDVKHIRMKRQRLYQFTAIDEATRYRVLQIYDHNNVRSAKAFVELVREKLPVAIERVRTDNGGEFGSEFTWHLQDLGIDHSRIPPGCPKANGKVERSHRTDSEEFYRRRRFKTAEELRRALQAWEDEYNRWRPHLALKGRTPAEYMAELKVRCDVVSAVA